MCRAVTGVPCFSRGSMLQTSTVSGRGADLCSSGQMLVGAEGICCGGWWPISVSIA